PMRRTAVLFCLLLICSAYTLPRWADWNQNSRLDLVLAMVDDGTVSIDRYVANTGDYALYRGHTYSDKPPGLSLLALPAYMALSPILNLPPVAERLSRLGRVGALESSLRAEGSGLREDKLRVALVQYLLTLLAVATPAAALGVLFYRLLLRLGASESLAALGTLAYGLGTTAAPYAGNFYSHQLCAALLFGAFTLAWPEDSVRRLDGARGLLCGLLLGWAVISEYPVALAATVIGVYALVRRGPRWIIPLAVGAALPGLLLVTYDIRAFGTIFPVGYAYSALWQDQHHTGFMSVTYPHPAALWGLTFGLFRGLFVRAPWLLLALPGFLSWWRMGRLRAEWWALLLVVLLTLLFYGSSMMWWGGFAAGPRYIVPMIPFLAIPAGYWVATHWQRSAHRALSVILIVLSVGMVWLETCAGQSFPPDTITNPWIGYVLPAWVTGDSARNLGMALGLRGPASLLPLVVIVISAGMFLLWTRRTLAPTTASAVAGE
ncbi:MAG: hypothetical protein WCK70_20345, partial [Chloroflexales bacterium]